MKRATLLAAIFFAVSAQAQQPVRLYAAGSLRSAMIEMASAFQKRSGVAVEATFGASGLLRERIEKGEPADVFASADLGHPRRLAAAGQAGEVQLFARNRLCGLARAGLQVDSENLLGRMLDPAVKLGTSTPKADPSGDYAFGLFAKAEAVHPGAQAALERKALKLVGGPDSAQAPQGRSVYAMLLREGKADLFLTYCTNAREAKLEDATLRVVPLADGLAVGADYGLTVLRNAGPQAASFARFVMSAEGQSILATHGFSPGGGT